MLKQAARERQIALRDPWLAAVALWSAITGAIAIPSQDVRRPFIGEVDVERVVKNTVNWLLEGMGSAAAPHPRGRQGSGQPIS